MYGSTVGPLPVIVVVVLSVNFLCLHLHWNFCCFGRNYQQILQFLSAALSREDNPLALDNICAAIARLIIVNISLVPMDQVLTDVSFIDDFDIDLFFSPATPGIPRAD